MYIEELNEGGWEMVCNWNYNGPHYVLDSVVCETEVCQYEKYRYFVLTKDNKYQYRICIEKSKYLKVEYKESTDDCYIVDSKLSEDEKEMLMEILCDKNTENYNISNWQMILKCKNILLEIELYSIDLPIPDYTKL